MLRTALLLLLTACGGGDTPYILEGTVLEVAPANIVVDHEAIAGLMGPMVMPFPVSPEIASTLKRGDRIVARLRVEKEGTRLEKVRVTGHRDLPTPKVTGPAPVEPGQPFPRTEIPVTGGETWVVGEGQGAPTVLTFLYTTCPLPEFCPLTLARLQALQPQLPAGARALAVTVDPTKDSLEALQTYATQAGADPARWRFGRLDAKALDALTLAAGLGVYEEEGKILHAIRWVVLDAQGRLIERYDDNALPLDRVVQQLATGGPPAPAGLDGTLSAPPSPSP